MKNIYKALADFQQEVPVIHKSTEGYNYTYADLVTIFKTINPLLKKHGLGFTQLVNKDCLKTIVFHIGSGEVIESETPLLENVRLNKMNDFQVLGSQITYLRRYALSSILGLITDKDTDAQGEQTKLPELTPTHNSWNSVVTALKGDYTIKQVRTKFTVSEANATKLMEEAL